MSHYCRVMACILSFQPGSSCCLCFQVNMVRSLSYNSPHPSQLTHRPGKVLATCSDSLCLLPKTSCELSAGSTGSSLLFLALLECRLSALLFCLLSLHFGHVRKLVFGLAALSRDNNPPPGPVTCSWTLVEKRSHDRVNNKLHAGDF